jgi:hypothetical protein
MGDGPLDFEDRDLQLSKAGDYWRPLNKTWSEVEQMARDADGGREEHLRTIGSPMDGRRKTLVKAYESLR